MRTKYSMIVGMLAVLVYGHEPKELSLQDLRREFRVNKKTYNSLKYKEWSKKKLASIKGIDITSSAFVDDVKEGLFGGWVAKLDLDPPLKKASVSDVKLILTKVNLAKAKEANRGSILYFKGKVKSITFNAFGSLNLVVTDCEILKIEEPKRKEAKKK